jgi:hypothetical protein
LLAQEYVLKFKYRRTKQVYPNQQNESEEKMHYNKKPNMSFKQESHEKLRNKFQQTGLVEKRARNCVFYFYIST